MKKMVIGLVAGMLIGSATVAAAATTQTVQATLAKFAITVDGEAQQLKSDPLVYKGTTYLPVREVANITGYDLQFDNKAKKIELQSKSEGVSSLSQSTSPTTTSSVTDEWIGLREFALSQGNVKLTSEADYSILIKDGNEILRFDQKSYQAQNTPFNGTTPEGKTVRVVNRDSMTMFNMNDLKSAGLIN